MESDDTKIILCGIVSVSVAQFDHILRGLGPHYNPAHSTPPPPLQVLWAGYLQSLGFYNINGDTEVVVLHPDYMEAINDILLDYYHGGDVDKKRYGGSVQI